MPDTLEGAAAGADAAPETEPSAEAVRAYVERNPGVLASLVTPHRDQRPGVIDLQRYVVDGLRRSLDRQEARGRQILAAAEARAQAVARVHAACRIALEASSLARLRARIAEDFPGALDVDAAALVGADPAWSRMIAAVGKRAGAVRLGAPDGQERAALGPGCLSAARVVVRSGPGHERLALLLGSHSAETFAEGQGTELLAFLGEVLWHCVRPWRPRPG